LGLVWHQCNIMNLCYSVYYNVTQWI